MVGDHWDFLYTASGPIAAGTYYVALDGEVEGMGSALQAELDDISDGGSVAPLFIENYALTNGGMYVGQIFDAGPTLPTIDAGCGDTLRLRISMTAGPDAGGFYYFGLELLLP